MRRSTERWGVIKKLALLSGAKDGLMCAIGS